MKKLVFLFCLALAVTYTNAQTRVSDNNSIGWLSTIVTPQVSKKVSLHLEYQWRRVKTVKEWQQSLARVGINYKANPNVTLHVGYGFIETFPYGELNLAATRKAFPEHRIYEQLVTTSTINKTTLTHRLRVEQRWLGRYTALDDNEAEYIYLNRVRYMPKIDVPLSDKWYASLYDEIFIGFGKNVGENVFDQNRIAVLVGYKFSNKFRIDGGFLNQTVQLGREIDGKNAFQYNNGVILSSYINL